MSEAVNRRINAVLVKKDGEVMAICTRCHEANPNREQVHSAECKIKGEDGNLLLYGVRADDSDRALAQHRRVGTPWRLSGAAGIPAVRVTSFSTSTFSGIQEAT